VQAALAALQTADSRLARSDRPQFLPLRKVLARDIERLKGTPGVDVGGLAMRLDQVIAQVDGLPLAFEERARATTGPAAARTDEGFWKRFGSEIWGEVKQLVLVRNLDRPEPPLLSPSQAFFMRENLKLRLLNARLALLARDQNVFRADLNLATTWVQRYFNVRSHPAAAALAISSVASKARAASVAGKFKLKYAPSFGTFRQHAGKDPIDNIKFMSDQGFRAVFDNGMMGKPADLVDKIVKELDRQIKEARRAATATLTLEDKLAGQKQVKALEQQRNSKRRALFDAQDEIDRQRERLIAEIESKSSKSFMILIGRGVIVKGDGTQVSSFKKDLLNDPYDFEMYPSSKKTFNLFFPKVESKDNPVLYLNTLYDYKYEPTGSSDILTAYQRTGKEEEHKFELNSFLKD